MKYVFSFSVFVVVVSIWLLAAPGKRSATHETTAQTKETAAKMEANEASAIETLKGIQSAEATYQSTTGKGSFGSWDELVRRELLNKNLVRKNQSGYRFRLQLQASSDQVVRSFLIMATPTTYNSTGRRTFSLDESGVIRFSLQRDATAASLEPLIDEGGGIDANEASAISILRTIFSSEATFQATAGNGDFGSLKELAKQGLINSVLAKGEKNGYLFRIRVEKTSSESRSFFEAHAVPRTYGQTGRRSFFVDASGTIRSADKNGKEASFNDEPIER
jgi:hypothetical protein